MLFQLVVHLYPEESGRLIRGMGRFGQRRGAGYPEEWGVPRQPRPPLPLLAVLSQAVGRTLGYSETYPASPRIAVGPSR
jgi:hypothetical protein